MAARSRNCCAGWLKANKKHLVPLLGDIPIDEIGPAQFQLVKGARPELVARGAIDNGSHEVEVIDTAPSVIRGRILRGLV